MAGILLRIRIPSVDTFRTVKVSGSDTVGEFVKQITKRIPTIDNSDEYGLVKVGDTSSGGTWLEEDRKIDQYGLSDKDTLELKKKPPGGIRRTMLGNKKAVGILNIFVVEQSTKLRKKFDEHTVAKTIISDVIRETNSNLDSKSLGLYYCGEFLDNDKPITQYGIYTGDTVALKSKENILNEDVNGNIKVEAKLSIPIKLDKYTLILSDLKSDSFVYEVKQKLLRKLSIPNAEEYELYINDSRLYDESILIDEVWLRDNTMQFLNYNINTNVNVELKPRKERITPIVDDKKSEDLELKDDVNIWDEVNLNSEEHIKFTFDKDKGIQVLQGATLNKLLERLTGEKEHDLLFMKIFILTYQSFTTPHIFLHKLIQRYNVPANTEEQTKKTIQLRVGNVLKSWLDLSFSDFDQDSRLFDKLNDFIDETLAKDGNSKLQSKLREFINRLMSSDNERKKVFTTAAPTPKIPRNLNNADFNFLDLDEEEIARQLTLIEYDTFAAIKPAELLNQAWAKPSLQKRAPNILAMIERFNNVSLWVATMIVKVENVKVRAKMMSKCVNIAKHLQKLNNFSTMMAFIAGLNNSSISRLSLTKKELPSRTVEDLASLEQVMSASSSYKSYRATLHNADPPLIPYTGVYLSDLTFIEDGNPDLIGNLINFQKREMVSKVIIELQVYQQTPYNLTVIPKISSILKRLNVKTEKELYQLSLLREPRQ